MRPDPRAILACIAMQWVSVATAADPAVVLSLRCVEEGATTTSRIDARVPVRVSFASETPAWIELVELGRDVRATGDDVETVDDGVPIRHGRILLALDSGGFVDVAPVVPTGAATPIEVTLHCGPIASKPDVAWRRRIAGIAQRARPPLDDATRRGLVTEAEALAIEAPTPAAKALALHLRAQVLFVAEQTMDAADAFTAAEAAWRDAGDATRATIARAGRVEELQRLSRYREILELSAETQTDATADPYFAARIGAARCVTLRYLAKLPESAACFDQAVTRFEDEREPHDLVNALLDLADVQRYSGDVAAATSTAARAVDSALFADMDIYRGRAHLLLADLGVGRGDLGGALRSYDAALSSFANAHASRWESNALMRAASLYGEIGASDEAYAFAESALSRLSERDAPARMAAARVALARIDLALGHTERARQRLTDAGATYARLEMAAELDMTHLMMARVLDASGRFADLRSSLHASQPTSLTRNDWLLLSASDAARRNECPRAIDLLRSVSATPSLAQRVDDARVRALCAYAENGNEAARRILHSAVVGVERLRIATRNPLLQRVITRRATSLRKLAIELELRDDPRRAAPPDAERLWLWSTVDAQLAHRDDAAADAAAMAFDAAVAKALFSHASANASAHTETARTLLKYLGAGGAAPTDPAALARLREPLSSLQARLRDDAMHLAVVDGGGLVAVVWATRRARGVSRVTDADALREAATRLAQITADVGAAVTDIERAAERVSVLLLRDVPIDPTVAHLSIRAEGVFSTLPWVLLNIGSARRSLSDIPRLSLVRPIVRAAGPTGGTTPSRLVVAAFSGNAMTPLPPLRNVDAEPTMIQLALSASPRSARVEVVRERRALLAALGEADSWIHVAAHGVSRPGAVAQSGILAASSEPADADVRSTFIGIADILSLHVASPLVVLNACQMADTRGSHGASGFSFTDALIAAGAREVVAAMWPVSDAASTLWIPAFYQRMSEPDHDAAAGVAQAQQRLRQSRAFRHPFYWASLVHVVGEDAAPDTGIERAD